MKYLKYICVLSLLFSCTNIENRANKNIEKQVIYNNQNKVLRDDVRVRLSNLEKNKLDIILDQNMLINGVTPNNLYIKVEAVDNTIYIDGESFDKIYITNENSIIKIGKYYFYGDIEIKALDSKLILINKLNMEKYLLGVIPFEMPASFPLEALKAQTVIARSYAYRNILRNKKDFDLYDGTISQVYQGIPNNSVDNVKRAINETKGEVIVYNNNIIDAVFHSYSGGYTASGKEVWGNDVPYLQAVEDNFSKGVHSSVLTWEFNIDKNTLNEKIGFIPINFDIKYSESNRVTSLILYNEDHTKEYIFTGNSFRKMFSLSKIKSTSFTINLNDEGMKVVGSGYGHGVGFSQWSSKTMAIDHNMNYIDIIKYFYKDVSVVKRGE
ncbi:SpoIID/LytB domain-containing protein [Streptobacillus felis]|uniref:SpoIID/LytB domain-containing protein n=1 Tax=Streptobacillus felis TaxID=1384509 RepID=A0A7Z0PFE4_9FUSO|nr:SpoIID/LytB domain-containing protein [Streptobacillus felis]NYV28211.1 SpoIID/LytB domain-containing protein [Streptobacillus felis]